MGNEVSPVGRLACLALEGMLDDNESRALFVQNKTVSGRVRLAYIVVEDPDDEDLSDLQEIADRLEARA